MTAAPHSGEAAATGPQADPVAELMAAAGPAILEELDEAYPASLLLVGRILGGRTGATDARIVGLDRNGVELLLRDGGHDHPVRVEFAEPVTDADLITRALFDLVRRARAESGEEGETEAERIDRERERLRTFFTTVASVEDVHPHLRRITLRGGDLATFEPVGPDTFVYFLLPPPGRRELTIDRTFTWELHARMPEDERPVGAYYTVRRWRPDVQEADVLVVLHGDDGHASRWAARAAPGDPVAIWGPRTAYHPPPGTAHLLVVADDTALPAAASVLEQLPPGTTATVLAEVAGEDEHQELPGGEGIDVTWLHRDGAAPGTTTLLPDAVRALPPLPARTYVWGGGETRAMTAIRRHVRSERGLPRDAVSLLDYWRRTEDGAAG